MSAVFAAQGSDLDARLAQIVQAMGDSAGERLVHLERIPAREARFAEPSAPLPLALRRALRMLGVSRLYLHQAEALDRARRGENIVVVTPTSSGKTLCYNLPVLEAVVRDPSAQALYIYPINALINDQYESLVKMNLGLGESMASVARYTGGVSSAERRAIRARNPNLILTNPEMVHLSFLSWHHIWSDFWQHLRFIVIDEIHTYRGIFGSNMAQLLRRVERVARHYGASPQFLCGSATIANPKELAETLTGASFAVVDRDGAGMGRRHFCLWNPPIEDAETNTRRSCVREAIDLLLQCLDRDLNTIVFARARRLTERMVRMATDALGNSGTDRATTAEAAGIASYRAGYLAQERADIETKLKLGEIRGIITTNALEVGIDIGALDAAIIAGYPGTIMSTWQQAGRAGRSGRDALVFMVASQNPLDQYYVRHPTDFYAQPHELATVDIGNAHIALKHLLCSAKELPFTPDELIRVPVDVVRLLESLESAGLLERKQDGTDSLSYPDSRRGIHMQVSLRSASHATYRIVAEGRSGPGSEIGTIEPPNLYREAHPGAIYQHGDDDYRVVYLDRANKLVRVRPETLPHYTRSTSSLTLHIEEIEATRALDLGGLPCQASLGTVSVQETVHGYQEFEIGSDTMIRRVNLDYPLGMRLSTTAAWLSLPPAVSENLRTDTVDAGADASEIGSDAALSDGLHAIQHLLTSIIPLVVMCDVRDIGGLAHPQHPDTGAPAAFVYDAYEGGIGLADVVYARMDALVPLAYGTAFQCGCQAGCPSCIQSATCRQRNEHLDKRAAISLLRALIASDHDAMSVSASAGWQRVAALRDTTVRRRHIGLQRAIQELDERTTRATLEKHLTSAEDRAEITLAREPTFVTGERVRHRTYGRGTVVSSRFRAGREMVTVRFTRRRGSTKEVDASTGALQKLG